MTWHRLFVVLAVFGGWCATAFGCAVLWLCGTEWSQRRRMRIERQNWINRGGS